MGTGHRYLGHMTLEEDNTARLYCSEQSIPTNEPKPSIKIPHTYTVFFFSLISENSKKIEGTMAEMIS